MQDEDLLQTLRVCASSCCPMVDSHLSSVHAGRCDLRMVTRATDVPTHQMCQCLVVESSDCAMSPQVFWPYRPFL